MDSAPFPRLVHLMYFPWDKSQRLKTDPLDFDRSFAARFTADHPSWKVVMWTLPEVVAFLSEHYPGIWDELSKLVVRPVMLIDYLRWVVVYQFGGIYWQYESTAHVPLDRFIPDGPNRVKLLTETVISDEFARKMASEPIRQGREEERVRVVTGAFAAYPRHPFVRDVMAKILENLRTLTVRNDYDILYITGNAMLSEHYHRNKDTLDDVQLVPLEERLKMVLFCSHGSWRTNPVIANEFKPVKMLDTIEAGGKTLKLNGFGLRKKGMLTLYAAGLYLEQPTSDPDLIVFRDQARQLRIVVTLNLEKSRLTGAIRTAFEQNNTAAMAWLEERLSRLIAAIPDLKADETLQLTYLPGRGTSVTVGSASETTVEGQDFADALFRVWLGGQPLAPDLKDRMLGIPESR